MGAWIEIGINSFSSFEKLVAPFVGAWIEIVYLLYLYYYLSRRTLRGCVD